MPAPRRFKQVDVFTREPFKGNPLAVILDADGLSDAQMQTIARWTNLSETTFVLPPTDATADYRLRIFSPDTEFAFAGHPTLGTAHALIEAGLQPKTAGRLIQQCQIGLVPIDIGLNGTLAFRAPTATQTTLDAALLPLLESSLGGQAVQNETLPVIADMGIKWLITRLPSAEACLAVRSNARAMAEFIARCGIAGVAIYGQHQSGAPTDYEIRALFTVNGMLLEDPVTGSANACMARVLQTQGFTDGARFAQSYTARQGTVLGRDGRISVSYQDGEPWIGGQTVTVIDGTLMA